MRRFLLGLYLLLAAADAAGKLLAATPAVNRVLAGVVRDEHVDDLREAARPDGNFEIFRTASRHLLSGEDLYAEYPQQHVDRFKYSPTFALLFAPFAWTWWPVALFLWSSLNALLLFYAIGRVLPARAAVVAQACMVLEVLRAMQNAQSNALVAALIVLTFVAFERGKAWGAAATALLGACVKIFPLAALSFALPRRLTLRTAAWAVALGIAFLALPLLVTSPATLMAQYQSWQGVEASDSLQRWFSVMQLVEQWTGAGWPNWPMQLAGTVALLAPLAVRRARWGDERFRLLYLCSVLLYVVLFNHQAERASYVIAFAGASIWFASSPREQWRSVLYWTAFVTIPLMSTLIPGAVFRTPSATTYRLALPILAIWIAVQFELWRGSRPQLNERGLGGLKRIKSDQPHAVL